MIYTGQSYVALDAKAVKLTWAASSEPDIMGYNVYASRRSTGPYTRLNNQPVEGTSYITKQMPYGFGYYRIIAIDESGNESLPSDTATVELK